MISDEQRRSVLVVVGAVLAAVALSLGAAGAAYPAVDLASKASRAGAVSPQAEYLRKLVRALPHSRITKATLGRPPRGFHGKRWVYFTLREVRLEGVHSEWQAQIVAGLLARETERRGWTRLAGYDLRWLQANGHVRYEGSSAISGFGPVQSTPQNDLVQRVQAGASEAGLTVQNVEVWSVLGHHAVEITALTDNPTQFLSDDYHQKLAKLTAGIVQGGKNGVPLVEGQYILVRDQTTRRWVAISAFATRLWSGEGGSNPYFPGG